MRFWILFAVLMAIIFLSCGRGGDKGGYAYHPYQPTQAINAEVGTITRFSVIGVDYIISRYAADHAIINSENYTLYPVRIRVSNAADTTVISNDWLLPDKYTAETTTLEVGTAYKFEVWVWQDGKNVTNCPSFTSDCFYEAGEQTVNF